MPNNENKRPTKKIIIKDLETVIMIKQDHTKYKMVRKDQQTMNLKNNQIKDHK